MKTVDDNLCRIPDGTVMISHMEYGNRLYVDFQDIITYLHRSRDEDMETVINELNKVGEKNG